MTDFLDERRARRPAPTRGNQARSERRTTRRAARRRQARRRLILSFSGLVIIVVVVIVLLLFVGVPGGGSGAATTQTAAAGPTQTSAQNRGTAVLPVTTLLAVQQGGKTLAFALLHPLSSGGVVMGLPEATLAKTSQGFKTLADLESSAQKDGLTSSLSDMLGVKVSGVTTVEWPELLRVLGRLGAGGTRPQTLDPAGTAPSLAAEAVVSLVGLVGGDSSRSTLEQMRLTGDAGVFRTALEAMGSGSWRQTVLPGKAVEGLGFAYFEPDTALAKILLGGHDPDAAVSLEVQNGSGLAGVAEAAAEILKPLGYTLLPVRNADGFPDVQTTRIIASADALGAADLVRTLLEVGTVEQDAAQAAGHIVVIIGKDFTPSTSSTSSTGG